LGEVIKLEIPCLLIKLANTWIILNPAGGAALHKQKSYSKQSE